jgi:hypothetical protein
VRTVEERCAQGCREGDQMDNGIPIHPRIFSTFLIRSIFISGAASLNVSLVRSCRATNF